MFIRNPPRQQFAPQRVQLQLCQEGLSIQIIEGEDSGDFNRNFFENFNSQFCVHAHVNTI